ncbi:MAG: peptidase [Magnetococcales bacterium]|nr:peptidase [Magnetococcales bacterium]
MSVPCASRAMDAGRINLRPTFFRGRGVFLLVALLAGHPIAGQADDDHEEARRLMQAGTILPLEKIVAESRKVRQGRLLEVTLKRHHGIYIYRLEVVTQQGVVWELEFDAGNGTLLELEREE